MPPPPHKSVSSQVCYMEVSADQFLHILHVYKAPSDRFLQILCRGTLKSVFLHAVWGPPQISFFSHTIIMRVPSDQFHYILYGDPHRISFITYYMRSPSDQFHHILYGGPSDKFQHILHGPPLRSFSCHTIWKPSQISCFTYYMGAP